MAVGGIRTPVFDLFAALKNSNLLKNKSLYDRYSHEEIISKSVKMLQQSGAPFILTWASIETLKKNISREDALFVLMILEFNPDNIRRKVAEEYLSIHADKYC